MPWKIIKKGNEFCVHKENTDGTAGDEITCHKTEQDAKNHLAALHANVPDASKTGARHSKSDMAIIAKANDAASQIQQHMRELGHGATENNNGEVIIPGTTVMKAEGLEESNQNNASVMTTVIALKSVGNEMVLEVLGAPFGSPYKDGKDSQGDYFDKTTDVGEKHYPEIPAIYAHGFNPTTRKQMDKPEIIGRAKYDHQDEHGHWYHVFLDKTSKFAQKIWAAALKGLAKASSGTIDYLVRRDANGHLKRWHVAELTLVDTSEGLQPANPYAIAIPMLKMDYELAGMKIEIKEDELSPEGGGNPSDRGESQNNNNNFSEGKLNMKVTKEQVLAEAAKLNLTLTDAEVDQYVADNKLPEAPAAKTNANPVASLLERVGQEIQVEQDKEAAKQKEESEITAKLRDLIKGIKRSEPANPAMRGAPALNLKTQQGDDEQKAFWHWMRTGDEGAYKTTRILNETDDEQGLALVPTGFYNKIVEKRDEVSIARAAGSQILQTDLKVVNIPVEKDRELDPVATAESGSGGDGATEYTYDINTVEPVDTLPVTVYKYTRMIRISEELLADQKANLEPFIGSRLGRAFGILENTLFLTGTHGALYGSGLGKGAAAATTIAASDILGLYYGLTQPYRNGAVWVMEGATEAAIRQLTGSPFAFVNTPQGAAGNVGIETLVGNQRVFNADIMPSIGASTSGNVGKSILFGNFEFFCIVERQGVTIRRLTERYAELGEVAFLASIRVGSDITQAEAFKHLLHPTG
jgi:HK97 family phage major capsid protein